METSYLVEIFPSRTSFWAERSKIKVKRTTWNFETTPIPLRLIFIDKSEAVNTLQQHCRLANKYVIRYRSSTNLSLRYSWRQSDAGPLYHGVQYRRRSSRCYTVLHSVHSKLVLYTVSGWFRLSPVLRHGLYVSCSRSYLFVVSCRVGNVFWMIIK